jgi:hypothetical protein
MLYKVVKKLWAEFFALRLWRCSGQSCNNQQGSGQMDVTAGLSRSERSRNNIGRSSNCSGRKLYGRERNGSGLPKSQPVTPVFLHISCKLLTSVLLAQQHGVYCHSLPGFCVRKCGNLNRGCCGGSNSDRIWELRFCNLLTRDFAIAGLWVRLPLFWSIIGMQRHVNPEFLFAPRAGC